MQKERISIQPMRVFPSISISVLWVTTVQLKQTKCRITQTLREKMAFWCRELTKPNVSLLSRPVFFFSDRRFRSQHNRKHFHILLQVSARIIQELRSDTHSNLCFKQKMEVNGNNRQRPLPSPYQIRAWLQSGYERGGWPKKCGLRSKYSFGGSLSVRLWRRRDSWDFSFLFNFTGPNTFDVVG